MSFDPNKDKQDEGVFWSVLITVILIIIVFVYSTIYKEEKVTTPEVLTKEEILEKIKER